MFNYFKNIIKEFTKPLVSVNTTTISETLKIEKKNGKVITLIVNGKRVDPKSAEGKKVIKDTDAKMKKNWAKFDKEMKKMSHDLEHMFDDFKL